MSGDPVAARAADVYEIRVEPLPRTGAARLVVAGWAVVAEVAGGLLPRPTTGRVVVRDRRRRTTLHRQDVTTDTVDALVVAVREDLETLDADAFRARWGSRRDAGG